MLSEDRAFICLQHQFSPPNEPLRFMTPLSLHWLSTLSCYNSPPRSLDELGGISSLVMRSCVQSPRLARCPLEERGWVGGTLEKKKKRRKKKRCHNEQKRDSARGKVLPYEAERKTRGRSRLLTLRVWLGDARRHQLDERDVLPAQQRWQK